MENQAGPANATPRWRTSQVYIMAAACLVVGIAVGYLFRGSASPDLPRNATVAAAPAATPGATGNQAMPSQHPTPTLEQMKKMADVKAKPLMDQLTKDPQNPKLLNQVGIVYEATHQFKEAEQYFQRALKVDPRNVAIRTEMASCMYYDGDIDGALSQLEQSLQYSPNDINSLYNLGMIRWQGKNDAAGALSAWEKLLKENPKFEKRAAVETSVARLKQETAAK